MLLAEPHAGDAVRLGVRGRAPAACGCTDEEARATANLSCPNVVTVLDFGVDDVPFLVMELLQGKSLRALLRAEHALPVARAVRIAAQMLNGLASAHRAGIIHRDVKPSNVMLVSSARRSSAETFRGFRRSRRAFRKSSP